MLLNKILNFEKFYVFLFLLNLAQDLNIKHYSPIKFSFEASSSCVACPRASNMQQIFLVASLRDHTIIFHFPLDQKYQKFLNLLLINKKKVFFSALQLKPCGNNSSLELWALATFLPCTARPEQEIQFR